ncbi:MAG: hypothetical protein V4552_08570 [Pseudomonadota bacterium]
MRVAHLKIKQAGATLILMMFIIALAATVYLLQAYDPAQLRLEQDKKTFVSLNEAKQALIAWSASHLYHPGQMPFPDRNADGNYDGISDCNSPASTFSYSFLLGQLPVYGQNNPCTAPQVGIGENYQDAQGNRLWYAVSRNLIHKYESSAIPPADPIINPNVISNPVYPWLVIKDRSGNVISNRVAAVIIAPGNPLTGQNRAGVAPDANQYLDNFNIGATNYSNANYDVPNEDFIIGQDSRDVSDADTSVTKPYYFNDKLVFITIDELMMAVTNRASSEAIKLLNQYRIKNGQFPYAANLGSSFNNHRSIDGITKGMLPIDVTDSCTCSSVSSCSCRFQPILSVTFYRRSGTWNTAQDTGLCSSAVDATGKNCTCTGAGSCSRTTRSFTCDVDGDCEAVNIAVNPLNKFIYKLNNHADFNKAGPSCVVNNNSIFSTMECNDSSDFTIGLKEPQWFKENLWQDYFYYEWSPTSALRVGEKTGVSAILISAGSLLTLTEAQPSSSQERPSSNLRNYLDSVQNTNNDSIFDATNKQKTNHYNDQTYIVIP